MDIDDKGHVKFFFNAFDNLDSDSDISLKGSFNRSISHNAARIKHYFSHKIKDTMPVGAVKEFFSAEIPNTTLFGQGVVSKLNLEYPLAKDLYNTYKFLKENGTDFEHSFMGKAIDYVRNEHGGITVKEWKLYEVSSVGYGANEFTPTLDVKEMDMFTIEKAFTVLEKMINLPYSDQTKRNIEKLAKLLSKYEQNETSPAGPQIAPAPPEKKALSTDDLKLLTNLIKL